MYLPLVLFAPRLSCMHGSVNTKSASATVSVLSFYMAPTTAGFRLQVQLKLILPSRFRFSFTEVDMWLSFFFFLCVIETFTRLFGM